MNATQIAIVKLLMTGPRTETGIAAYLGVSVQRVQYETAVPAFVSQWKRYHGDWVREVRLRKCSNTLHSGN